jgi:antitoxin component of MazEF toxin-antitoxin module
MTHPSIRAEATIQQWGTDFAVQLSASIASAAGLTKGTSLTAEVVSNGILLRIIRKPEMTLAQKLEAFDPALHGGEMPTSARMAA